MTSVELLRNRLSTKAPPYLRWEKLDSIADQGVHLITRILRYVCESGNTYILINDSNIYFQILRKRNFQHILGFLRCNRVLYILL